jgi:hypothetical protein
VRHNNTTGSDSQRRSKLILWMVIQGSDQLSLAVLKLGRWKWKNRIRAGYFNATP